MKYEKLLAIKPLTKAMVELLKHCHTTETNTATHLKLFDQSAVEGLIERDLIKKSTHLKDGTQEIIYVVTDTGKLYLQHYFKM